MNPSTMTNGKHRHCCFREDDPFAAFEEDMKNSNRVLLPFFSEESSREQPSYCCDQILAGLFTNVIW